MKRTPLSQNSLRSIEIHFNTGTIRSPRTVTIMNLRAFDGANEFQSFESTLVFSHVIQAVPCRSIQPSAFMEFVISIHFAGNGIILIRVLVIHKFGSDKVFGVGLNFDVRRPALRVFWKWPFRFRIDHLNEKISTAYHCVYVVCRTMRSFFLAYPQYYPKQMNDLRWAWKIQIFVYRKEKGAHPRSCERVDLSRRLEYSHRIAEHANPVL